MDEPLKWRPEGVPLRLDPEAESTDPSLPAFLARPEGAPVYHGFPLLEESRTADGWCFGIISDPECPEGRNWGDAFVVAPDGSRAGLIWEVGAAVLEVSLPPEKARWGGLHAWVRALGPQRPRAGAATPRVVARTSSASSRMAGESEG